MKSFKQFLNEETMPYASNAKGIIDIENSSVRDGLNSQLAGVTAEKVITPYIALERVSKALANYHIFIPRHSFLEGDSGMLVWPINQFGLKIGQQNDGSFVQDGVVLKDTSKGIESEGEDNKVMSEPNRETEKKFSIFFEYRQSDCGMFNVFCEVVSQEELDEILEDLEDEMNDDDEDEEELNEENIQELSTDKYIAAKKEAERRKKMADENPSGTSEKFSKYYGMVKDRADRLIKKKIGEQTTPSTFSQARAGVGGASATTGVTPRSYSDSDGTTPRDNTSKGPVPGEIPEPKMRYKDIANSDEKEPVPNKDLSIKEQKLTDDDKASIAIRKTVAKMKLKDAQKETRPGYVKKQSQAWYDKMIKRANAKIDEEKFTNRVPSSNPYGNLDAAKKEMNKNTIPTRDTKDLDKMNRDSEGNTVVEGNKENKEKKKEILTKGGKIRLRDVRAKMKDKFQSSFDPRDLKQVAESSEWKRIDEDSVIDNHQKMIDYHKKMEDKHGSYRLDSLHSQAGFEHKNAADEHEKAIKLYKKDPNDIDYKLAARTAENFTKKAKESSNHLYIKEEKKNEDELNEITKEFIKTKYLPKARPQLAQAKSALLASKNPQAQQKIMKFIRKRGRGVSRAENKLTKDVMAKYDQEIKTTFSPENVAKMFAAQNKAREEDPGFIKWKARKEK